MISRPNPTAHLVGAGGTRLFIHRGLHSSGRHRAPGRFNPRLRSCPGIVASAAQPAVKTSAVIAASGGLVASFALPASCRHGQPEVGAPRPPLSPRPLAGCRRPRPQHRRDQRLRRHRLQGDRQARQAEARRRRSAHARPQQLPTASRSTAHDYTSLKPACGWRSRHRGPVRRPDVLLRRHQPVDRLRLLRLHACTSSRQVGISLPHTADAQRSGRHPRVHPQPGDLVFVYNGGGGASATSRSTPAAATGGRRPTPASGRQAPRLVHERVLRPGALGPAPRAHRAPEPCGLASPP